MSHNLKYLKESIDDPVFFGVILNDFAKKHSDHIQKRIALSLLEFFNNGRAIDFNSIKKNGEIYYICI